MGTTTRPNAVLVLLVKTAIPASSSLQRYATSSRTPVQLRDRGTAGRRSRQLDRLADRGRSRDHRRAARDRNGEQRHCPTGLGAVARQIAPEAAIVKDFTTSGNSTSCFAAPVPALRAAWTACRHASRQQAWWALAHLAHPAGFGDCDGLPMVTPRRWDTRRVPWKPSHRPRTVRPRRIIGGGAKRRRQTDETRQA